MISQEKKVRNFQDTYEEMEQQRIEIAEKSQETCTQAKMNYLTRCLKKRISGRIYGKDSTDTACITAQI